MSSLDKLASIHPKENAGASSSNRFEYQINWGLHRLLQLEKAHEDYVMILDYHDDIVICNSEKQEDYIDFYQIKTRTYSRWGIRQLCEADSKESKDEGCENTKNSNNSDKDSNDNNVKVANKLSIIAKLLSHTKTFDDTRNLYFITNEYITFTHNKKYVEFKSLDEISKKSIIERISKQVEGLDEEAFNKLIFVRTTLPESGYRDMMTGEIVRFLKENWHLATDADEVYINLTSWLRKQSNYENLVDNREELLKFKSITHKEFNDYLIGLTLLRSFDKIESRIKEQLRYVASEKAKVELTFAKMEQIGNTLKQIQTDLLNYNNDELLRLITLIRTTLNDNAILEDIDIDFWTYVSRIYSLLMGKYNNYQNYEELYIKSLIMYIYDEK